jgi:Spy/CpxP family protein refolding chaperone
MKMKRFLLALVGFTLVSVSLAARELEPAGFRSKDPGMDGRGPGAWSRRDAGAWDETALHFDGMRALARWKEELGLSETQVEKLKSLHERRRDDRSFRRAVRDLRQKLEDQIEDKASDADIAATLEQLEAAEARLREAREKQRTEREAILTPTQRAKLRLGRLERAQARRQARREQGREHREAGRAGGSERPLPEEE